MVFVGYYDISVQAGSILILDVGYWAISTLVIHVGYTLTTHLRHSP